MKFKYGLPLAMLIILSIILCLLISSKTWGYIIAAPILGVGISALGAFSISTASLLTYFLVGSVILTVPMLFIGFILDKVEKWKRGIKEYRIIWILFFGILLIVYISSFFLFAFKLVYG